MLLLFFFPKVVKKDNKVIIKIVIRINYECFV